MRTIFHALIAAFAALALALPAAAADTQLGYTALKKKASFEDVEADLRDAIINRGMKVDYVGHIGKMLERTSSAVGSVTEEGSKSPYKEAKYFQFCSAKITHDVISKNPLNISICPYVIFLFELKTEPGVVHIGYRRPFGGPSAISRKAIAQVETLLSKIIHEVAR